MTQTYTITETWSRTHARYVAGKVAADLRQMQQAYGAPTDKRLNEYLDELTVLLADGLLKEITYGFRKNGVWLVALRYTADMNGGLSADDRSGLIPRGVSILGATWGSFLAKSSKWDALSTLAQARIEGELPFRRDDATAPIDGSPARHDKTYSSVGCGLSRASIGSAS